MASIDAMIVGVMQSPLRRAEDHAKAKGCAIVLLDSHSFQASGFYEKHGYLRQAEITDHPVGHSRIVPAKRLAGGSGT